jgi:hypothetical protein
VTPYSLCRPLLVDACAWPPMVDREFLGRLGPVDRDAVQVTRVVGGQCGFPEYPLGIQTLYETTEFRAVRLAMRRGDQILWWADWEQVRG